MPSEKMSLELHDELKTAYRRTAHQWFHEAGYDPWTGDWDDDNGFYDRDPEEGSR